MSNIHTLTDTATDFIINKDEFSKSMKLNRQKYDTAKENAVKERMRADLLESKLKDAVDAVKQKDQELKVYKDKKPAKGELKALLFEDYDFDTEAKKYKENYLKKLEEEINKKYSY